MAKGRRVILNKYETIIIIDPNVESQDVETIVEDVQNLISGSEGEVTKVDKWGKRRLAYEVKGNRDGVYVLIDFNADSEFIQRLERYYGLTEQIIKYMTVRAEMLPTEPRGVREVADEDEDEDEERLYGESEDEEDER